MMGCCHCVQEIGGSADCNHCGGTGHTHETLVTCPVAGTMPAWEPKFSAGQTVVVTATGLVTKIHSLAPNPHHYFLQKKGAASLPLTTTLGQPLPVPEEKLSLVKYPPGTPVTINGLTTLTTMGYTTEVHSFVPGEEKPYVLAQVPGKGYPMVGLDGSTIHFAESDISAVKKKAVATFPKLADSDLPTLKVGDLVVVKPGHHLSDDYKELTGQHRTISSVTHVGGSPHYTLGANAKGDPVKDGQGFIMWFTPSDLEKVEVVFAKGDKVVVSKVGDSFYGTLATVKYFFPGHETPYVLADEKDHILQHDGLVKSYAASSLCMAALPEITDPDQPKFVGGQLVAVLSGKFKGFVGTIAAVDVSTPVTPYYGLLDAANGYKIGEPFLNEKWYWFAEINLEPATQVSFAKTTTAVKTKAVLNTTKKSGAKTPLKFGIGSKVRVVKDKDYPDADWMHWVASVFWAEPGYPAPYKLAGPGGLALCIPGQKMAQVFLEEELEPVYAKGDFVRVVKDTGYSSYAQPPYVGQIFQVLSEDAEKEYPDWALGGSGCPYVLADDDGLPFYGCAEDEEDFNENEPLLFSYDELELVMPGTVGDV